MGAPMEPHYLSKENDVIANFYNNANILITGATGFVGKALLGKLLTSCEDIKSIHLLMRPKRGRSIEERLEHLLQNAVFDNIREKSEVIFDKIKIINGDVSMPKLGLNDSDRQYLVENINIVFHSAATVKFDETLKNAIILNTFGTKQVMELCNEMHNLKCLVHVSTAYSNCDKPVVDEVIYNPPIDPNIATFINKMPQEAIDAIEKTLLETHPNTYTVTKAMAEYVVFQEFSSFPIAIVRPSIITSAWKEPFPGWVDSLSGITGIYMECGRGTIQSICCNGKCRMDLIPVDIVTNTIITAAWHTGTNASVRVKVYNCTSGSINPLSWKEFGNFCTEHAKICPSKYIAWFPGLSYHSTLVMHYLYTFVYSIIPSTVYDIFLFISKQKPIMLTMNRKFYAAMRAGRFFSTKEWDFKTTSISELIKAVNSAKDGMNFEINISKENGFDWSDYMKDFSFGVRKYILKDDISSLNKARAKLRILYWIHRLYQIGLIFVFYNFLRRIRRIR